jgi:hypothetical protein
MLPALLIVKLFLNQNASSAPPQLTRKSKTETAKPLENLPTTTSADREEGKKAIGADSDEWT